MQLSIEKWYRERLERGMTRLYVVRYSPCTPRVRQPSSRYYKMNVFHYALYLYCSATISDIDGSLDIWHDTAFLLAPLHAKVLPYSQHQRLGAIYNTGTDIISLVGIASVTVLNSDETNPSCMKTPGPILCRCTFGTSLHIHHVLLRDAIRTCEVTHTIPSPDQLRKMYTRMTFTGIYRYIRVLLRPAAMPQAGRV